MGGGLLLGASFRQEQLIFKLIDMFLKNSLFLLDILLNLLEKTQILQPLLPLRLKLPPTPLLPFIDSLRVLEGVFRIDLDQLFKGELA
jgi:hypothetical protein